MNIGGWQTISLEKILISRNDKSKQVKSSDYLAIGIYPIVDQSSDFICGYCDDSRKVISSGLPYTILVIIRDIQNLLISPLLLARMGHKY